LTYLPIYPTITLACFFSVLFISLHFISVSGGYIMEIKEGLICGMWKFRNALPPGVLINIAKQWEEENNRYLDLHVRKCSKNQIGIGFKYELRKDQTYEEFVEMITDFLKRNHGNNFVGWDISRMTWVIKQEGMNKTC